MRHQTRTTASYFTPKFRVDYKPVNGIFKFYDTESKKQEEMDSLTIYPISAFTRVVISGDDSSRSDIFVDPATDVITMRDFNFQNLGQFYLRKTTKDGRQVYSLFEKETGRESTKLLKPKLATVVLGMTEDGDTVMFEFSGVVRSDILIKNKDGTNAEKVKVFRDCEKIRFTAVEETVMAGAAKGRQKPIHLLNLEGFDEHLPEKFSAAADAAHDKILSEIKARNSNTKPVEQLSDTDASDVFEDDDSDDKPF